MKPFADFSRVVMCVLLVTSGMATAVHGAAVITLADRGICAHRGGATTHPENTLPAYQEAIRLGAHMVELDIAISRHGVLVLMHDATVNRINYFYTNDPAEATRLLGLGVDFVLVDSVEAVLSRQRNLAPLVPRW